MVGRLDVNTSGLLIFSNNGDLVRNCPIQVRDEEILPMSSIWKSKKISDKKIIEWS